jgi:hypothetical protein
VQAIAHGRPTNSASCSPGSNLNGNFSPTKSAEAADSPLYTPQKGQSQLPQAIGKQGPKVMPLSPRPHIQPAFGRATVLQNLTLIFCILFGLAMIANTQAANDGGWFWYAMFFHNGQHLYADLHLALQPLFVLETASFLALLGKGWLVSKVPAVLHLVAYCVGLLLVARSSVLSDGRKALILACAFLTSINFVAYRFDDYHVLADCFQVYSLVALLSLQQASGLGQRLRLTAILGILTGLSFTTRLNDGAALYVGVVIAILCLAPARRVLSLTLFSATAALTVLLVVRLTGDSLHDWATYTIFKAAAIKGGTHNVLAEPLQLPWNTLKFLWNPGIILMSVYSFWIILIWTSQIRPAWRTTGRRDIARLCAGVALILVPTFCVRHFAVNSTAILVFPPLGVLVTCGICLVVLVRLLRHWLVPATAPNWNPREVLLLIPLGQMVSGSMSSGGSPLGLDAPIAMIILLLPIATPIHPKRESVRAFAFAILALLTVECGAQKYSTPFFWHSYKVSRMFTERQWYHHPDYGPMIIEHDQLAFIQPICDAVKADGAQQGLLSLPFPYPNYFCSIPPWHAYVQTFFDTTSKDTIDHLMAELQSSPPKWIVYQRQLDNLSLHEQIYNHGNPLPQRYLDQMIQQKIAGGDWHVVYTSNFDDLPQLHNQWFLIRTR